MRERHQSEFEEKVIQVDRVSRVMAGGKRMRFRAVVAIGNRNGKIGIGIAKALEVSGAVAKAVAVAKKHLITIPIIEGTIPHEIVVTCDRARVLLKPARSGTGIIAGGAVRAIIKLSGIKNILTKMLGSSNKVNNAQAVFLALSSLRTRESVYALRGKEFKKPAEVPSLPNESNKSKRKK
jgi:small subunit ribosomal protein S5